MPKRVRDVRPPNWAVAPINPLLRLELRTPLAHVLPWATMTFYGRRSGRRIEVVVRWYPQLGEPMVFTPNAWRANFEGGHPVDVRYRNAVTRLTGELVRDPSEVAIALNDLLDCGLWVPAGRRVPRGQRFSAADVAALDTHMIRFS